MLGCIYSNRPLKNSHGKSQTENLEGMKQAHKDPPLHFSLSPQLPSFLWAQAQQINLILLLLSISSFILFVADTCKWVKWAQIREACRFESWSLCILMFCSFSFVIFHFIWLKFDSKNITYVIVCSVNCVLSSFLPFHNAFPLIHKED